jgi:hypothetical protein
LRGALDAGAEMSGSVSWENFIGRRRYSPVIGYNEGKQSKKRVVGRPVKEKMFEDFRPNGSLSRNYGTH